MVKNIFDINVSNEFIERINQLTPETKALWGKMNVSQMLAHCCVTYEYVYDNIHVKPKGFKKFILKVFVKNLVVNEKPYKKNNPTAPDFVMANDKNFDLEKERLINYIRRTQELGENHFENKDSHSFGVLNKTQWKNMFSKHLDHHFSQFGV